MTFLTVHGRTPQQKIAEPSNHELLREVKQSLSVPMIANGDCKTLEDAEEMYKIIGCDGVMAARSILANPTLFCGKYESTPIECVQDWLDISAGTDKPMAFQFWHHHLTFMMEKLVRRKQRVVLNSFTRRHNVEEFLEENFNLRAKPMDLPPNIECVYDETNFRDRLRQLKIGAAQRARNEYSAVNTPGKFFLEKVDDDLDASDDCDAADIFQTNMFDSD